MRLLTSIIILISLHSCGRSNDRPPSTIDKDAQFLHVSLDISPKDKKTILANLRILNTSKDSVLLYRPLFPFDGQIGFPCFSIFNAKTYNQVSFSRPIAKFNTYDPYDEGEEIIIAEQAPEKYFILRSGEVVSFQVNLADWYNFEPFHSGEEFKVVPSISNPLVTDHYKQKFEKDTVDGKMKPVLYYITLPQKNDIDSMRVKFTLP